MKFHSSLIRLWLCNSFVNRKVESRPNKHFFYTEWRFRREEVSNSYSGKISIRFSQSRDRDREILYGPCEEKIEIGRHNPMLESPERKEGKPLSGVWFLTTLAICLSLCWRSTGSRYSLVSSSLPFSPFPCLAFFPVSCARLAVYSAYMLGFLSVIECFHALPLLSVDPLPKENPLLLLEFCPFSPMGSPPRDDLFLPDSCPSPNFCYFCPPYLPHPNAPELE